MLVLQKPKTNIAKEMHYLLSEIIDETKDMFFKKGLLVKNKCFSLL